MRNRGKNQMNKKEYLDTLGKALGAMPYKDVNEILYEIGAHFSEGSLKGKTEEEIAEGLGDPNELAAMYREGMKLPEIMKKRNKIFDDTKTGADGRSKLFVVLFNAFVGVECWLVILFAIFIAACIFLGSLGGIAAIVTAIVTGNVTYYLVPAILLAVTLLFFAVFLFILVVLGIKYFAKGTKAYINWNKRIWTKGFGEA